MIDNGLTLGISVIICCYNSTLRLPETLTHLAAQQVTDGLNWEVIVVDNASTDNTAETAQQIWDSLNVPQFKFRVFDEPVAGKNKALEKGIAEAQYSYLIVCDDDNWLYPNYVTKAFDAIHVDPMIAIVGGNGIFEPELPVNPAIKNLEKNYTNGPQPWALTEHWVYGAGAVYRKSVLHELAKKQWHLITPGRVGNKLNGGEDTELCLITYLSGYKIIADDTLFFKHFVPAKRQNLKYIYDLQYWQSYSNTLLYSYYAIIHNSQQSIEFVTKKWLISITKTVAKQFVLLSFQKTFKRKPLTVDQQMSFHSNLGTWRCLFINRNKIITHHYYLKKILSSKNKKGTLK